VFGRRAKKEAAELKEKYSELEGKFDELSTDYKKLKEEGGEGTSMRISAIEEEIESMNVRVEKLAKDSYEIHSEVRDIKDSVQDMHKSLKEIVALYKAILTRYGTPQMQEQMRARARRSGESPGDSVIRALRDEQASTSPRSEAPRATPAQKRAATAAAIAPAEPRPPPPPSSLDELHRLEAEDRGTGQLEGDALARRLDGRDQGRMDRVVRRDMGRPSPITAGADEGFLRSLPKKEVVRRAPGASSAPGEGMPEGGEGWEEAPAPEGRRRPPPDDEEPGG